MYVSPVGTHSSPSTPFTPLIPSSLFYQGTHTYCHEGRGDSGALTHPLSPFLNREDEETESGRREREEETERYSSEKWGHLTLVQLAALER